MRGRFHTDRIDTHGHSFVARNALSHFDEGTLRRLATVAPGIRPLGPEHPAAGMRLPFCGHTESVRSWS